MILLDTNAVIFLLATLPRGRALAPHAGQLAISPITLLELTFLVECKRIAFVGAEPAVTVRRDPRWTLDDPPLDTLIARALDLHFTRDPFDRLIAAHALARGWRLATSDRTLLHHLPASATLAL